jgi:hypothetical protein
VHRVTRRAPAEMLAQERAALHPIPASPHTVAFGVSRVVPGNTPMVAFEGGQYSVPHTLLGETVWVRVHGHGAHEQVIVVHVSPHGPVEVARHARATPGSPKIDDTHFPAATAGPLNRKPVARNASEVEFLAIGDGARLWLAEAAAAGTTKIRVKMARLWPWRSCSRPRTWTGRWATPRSTPGSRTATSPRSWTTTTPRPRTVPPARPARTAR